jgi:ATP-dependent Clp protease adaptor protein ClpS
VLPGTSPEQAEKLAWQIHRSGLALVWCGHQELAELYHEQLKAAALTLAPLER